MDWEDFMIWRANQDELVAYREEMEQEARLRDMEDERDYFAQFDND